MIETARLRLRLPHSDDAPAVAALMTPAVSRWLGTWSVPFTIEIAEARIVGALRAMARGDTLYCAIEHQAKLAGWIGGARLPGTCRAAFGFWLGEPHQGQALMQEAAPAYVAALRDRLALDSIEAACQPENHGSARVLAACGLRRTGQRMHYAEARNREEFVDVWERTWTPETPSLPS